MALVFMSIPIMVLVVALAVVPGIVATYMDALDERTAKPPTRVPSVPEEETKLAA